MRHVLAIDQGTTGSTALVLSQHGRIVGRGYREITQHYPQPGWVEHDPAELLSRTTAAVREAIDASGVIPDALGITNQRETVVLWDRTSGEAVSRAIVWQDRRTSARCAQLRADEERIHALTGLVADPYFSATKVEWMLRDEKLRRRAEAGELAAGTVDSWLIYKLTGGKLHATDFSNASRTLLFDIHRREWSPLLLELFGVPAGILPEVRLSSGDFGVATADHFGTEIPILGVAGDQQAALFGQGCWEAGSMKNTYGTGAFLLYNAGATAPAPASEHGYHRDGLLTTLGCDASGAPCYALEAAIFIAGAALQWLRDGLGLITSASESEALARSVESTDGVFFVPAFTGLGAPHWEPEARGTLVGLTRGTRKAHVVRAALESMAYSTFDTLQLMRARVSASANEDALRVDGGVANNDWFLQYQSEVLQLPVERPASVETTALGAAGLAGLAAGIWSSASDFAGTASYTRFAPSASGSARGLAATEALRGWHRAVRAALHWATDRRD